MGFWKKKRVIVTGATGFLGAFLCKALVNQNAHVVGIARKKNLRLLKRHGISNQIKIFPVDITDPAKVKRVFEKTKPEYCFHLAGFSSPKKSDEMPLEAISANLDGSLSIILQCAKQGVTLVAASSVRVYPLKGIFDENSQADPSRTYAFSKLKMEEVIRFLVRKKKLNGVVVRFGTLYGPMHFPATEHFVNNNIACALSGKKAKNEKNYVRDFLFVDDAIEGILAAGKNAARFSGETFNISFGKSFSGPDVAKQINALVKNHKPVFAPNKSQRIKNDFALKKLGWKPRVSLKQGLQKTIIWHQQNPGVNQ